MAFLSRRSVLLGMSTAFGAGTLKHALAQQKEPIKIALLLPLSGPGQVVGQSARTGAEITTDMLNKSGGVLGRQIAVTYYDDMTRPDAAVSALREAVSAGHNLLSGTIHSPLILAQIPLLAETKSILITGAGQAMSFTHENFSRNLFRANDNDYQRVRVLARLAAQKFPDIVNWVGVCTDSEAYTDSYKNFVKLATAEYGAIGRNPVFADPVVAKFGTTEFRSQLSALSVTPGLGVFNAIVGNDGITFWQQARPFPFIKNIKAVIDQQFDVPAAKALRTNLPPHCWTFMMWYYALHANNPLSQAFYDQYVERTKDHTPGGWVSYGHFGLTSYAQAINAANGATDTETIIRTLEVTSIDTIKGPITYRKEDHQMVGNLDIVNFVGSDKDPGFTVEGTASYHGADVLEPPDPGHAFKL